MQNAINKTQPVLRKPKARVLLVDDHPILRQGLARLINLEPDLCVCGEAEDAANAFTAVEELKPDVVVADISLKHGNGIELVRHIQEKYPYLPVAVITAFGNMETAVAALKAGAFDFVSKPLDLNDLRNIVRSALRVGQSPVIRTAASSNEPALSGTKKMLGESAATQKVRAMIERLARGQAPVYIAGESGTGKTVTVKALV